MYKHDIQRAIILIGKIQNEHITGKFCRATNHYNALYNIYSTHVNIDIQVLTMQGGE